MIAPFTSWRQSQPPDSALHEPPAPRVKPTIAASAPPPKFDQHERNRVRAAAFRAKQVYPHAVGELVCRELLDWEAFGWRCGVGSDALVWRLVRHVEAMPSPVAERAS